MASEVGTTTKSTSSRSADGPSTKIGCPINLTDEVSSLRELLHTASGSGGKISICEPHHDEVSINIDYKDLLRASEEKAVLISQLPDLTPDSVVLIHFDNHKQNIEWLWAVIHAGLIPAISTPFSSDADQRHNHIKHLKKLLNDPLMLTSTRQVALYPELEMLRYQRIELFPKDISDSDCGAIVPVPCINRPKELPAILMLTSGSTGNAKAVALTVRQIIDSVKGKIEACGTTSSSVFLNWIGMDHVANLTEIHLHAMYLGANQVHVQANDLLADPFLFLRLLAKHQVTHTFAPNFFLAILEKQLQRCPASDPIWKVDLRALRSIISGGEANVIQTAENLSKLLINLGVQGRVIRAAYGLTESSAGLIYNMLDMGFERSEKHEFASLGHPITGANVRVTKDDGQIASVCEVGNLELAGSVVFKNYYNDPDATRKAFTKDGWYITGDRAYVDSYQKLNMAGRAKEMIVVNGVKFFPPDVEAAIEKASLPGVIPSFTAAFSHRPPGSSTETYCAVYGSNPEQDHRMAMRTVDAIAKIGSGLIGSRPMWVIPLPTNRLDKSALGKLSRSRIQIQFERGAYDGNKIDAAIAMRAVAMEDRVPPETETQAKIVKVLSEMLDLSSDEVSIDRTIFELGISSIGLFKLEQKLRKQFQGTALSAITFLSNPVIRHIANAFDNENSRHYDPVVQLQAQGSKIPLWLVHPASGNVLAFLPLSRTVTDRPLFALTARGLGKQENLFSSIPEMAETYFKHIKLTQPVGPYAITGYSLGTTVSFEIAKRLEQNGDRVAFCAALDSPPHVIPLVENLDWCAAAVLVSYFLELIPQDDVPPLITRFRGLSKLDIVKGILGVSRPEQRTDLNLDPEQLLAIVNVTDNFGTMAKAYHPEGQVQKMDVFYCTPLRTVEKERHTWIRDHLSKWQNFSASSIEYHECDGEHAEMLNPTNVVGFEQRLSKALQARGI